MHTNTQTAQGTCEKFPLKVVKFSLQMPLNLLSGLSLRSGGIRWVRKCEGFTGSERPHSEGFWWVQTLQCLRAPRVSFWATVYRAPRVGFSHNNVSFWLPLRWEAFFQSLRTKILSHSGCSSGKKVPKVYNWKIIIIIIIKSRSSLGSTSSWEQPASLKSSRRSQARCCLSRLKPNEHFWDHTRASGRCHHSPSLPWSQKEQFLFLGPVSLRETEIL